MLLHSVLRNELLGCQATEALRLTLVGEGGLLEEVVTEFEHLNFILLGLSQSLEIWRILSRPTLLFLRTWRLRGPF